MNSDHIEGDEDMASEKDSEKSLRVSRMTPAQIFCEAITMAREMRKPIYLIQSARGQIYLNESGCICHPKAHVPGSFVKAIVFPDPEFVKAIVFPDPEADE